MKRKKTIISSEEHLKMKLESQLKQIKADIEMGKFSTNPSRLFNVGDRVIWGAHIEVYVREVCDDGVYYLVESIGVKREINAIPQNEFHYLCWYDIFPSEGKFDSSFHK